MREGDLFLATPGRRGNEETHKEEKIAAIPEKAVGVALAVCLCLPAVSVSLSLPSTAYLQPLFHFQTKLRIHLKIHVALFKTWG